MVVGKREMSQDLAPQGLDRGLERHGACDRRDQNGAASRESVRIGGVGSDVIGGMVREHEAVVVGPGAADGRLQGSPFLGCKVARPGGDDDIGAFETPREFTERPRRQREPGAEGTSAIYQYDLEVAMKTQRLSLFRQTE